jgi:hypothetical protein
MKYLTPVIVSIAATIAAIATALAQAHGALIGGAWLNPPYVYGYATAAVLTLIALVAAINTGRQDKRANADDKHKQIKIRLAALIKQEHEIYASLKASSDNSEYTELIRKANDWTNDVTTLLNEVEPTDAEIFSQVGHLELSAEQLGRVAHVPPWKRAEIARFLLYIQTLDQIRSNRRL